MFRIALVDDSPQDLDHMEQLLRCYEEKRKVSFLVSRFQSGHAFFNSCRSRTVYDIVFLDMSMPQMNGVECARQLRAFDTSVVIVFVTNLPQFAVEGYSVDALDYLIKPLEYYSFEMKLHRALLRVEREQREKALLSTNEGLICCPLKQIRYIEISRHHILYHTEDGTYTSYGTMKKLLDQFPGDLFVLCNSGYLVNLRHVTAVVGDSLYLGKECLPISRGKKKDFLSALNNYIAGGGT